MVVVKLLNERAKVSEMGRLYACEHAIGLSVRTGVSVTVPSGMRGVVHSPLVAHPCDIESGEEIVLSCSARVAEGECVGSLAFLPTQIVVEGNASEMGPLA
jgi:hypothetical protein